MNHTGSAAEQHPPTFSTSNYGNTQNLHSFPVQARNELNVKIQAEAFVPITAWLTKYDQAVVSRAALSPSLLTTGWLQGYSTCAACMCCDTSVSLWKGLVRSSSQGSCFTLARCCGRQMPAAFKRCCRAASLPQLLVQRRPASLSAKNVNPPAHAQLLLPPDCSSLSSLLLATQPSLPFRLAISLLLLPPGQTGAGLMAVPCSALFHCSLPSCPLWACKPLPSRGPCTRPTMQTPLLASTCRCPARHCSLPRLLPALQTKQKAVNKAYEEQESNQSKLDGMKKKLDKVGTTTTCCSVLTCGWSTTSVICAVQQLDLPGSLS